MSTSDVRRNKMLEYVRKKHTASIKELSTKFPDISTMTIHRDLDVLCAEGVLIRIRGGVRYPEYNGELKISERQTKNSSEKNAIVKKAYELLKNRCSVYFDSGTTMLAFATNMPDMDLNILTSSPAVGLAALSKQKCSISLLGGNINRDNCSISGSNATEMIKNLNIDIAFMVPTGYYPGVGFTCGNEQEAQLKRLVIKKASTVVMLTDSSKFNQKLLYTFATESEIDYFITDSEMGEEIILALQDTDVTII